MNRIVESAILVLVSLVAGDRKGEIGSDSRAIVISKDAKRMVFAVPISSVERIDNVVFCEERVGKRWLLQFRKYNGLNITKDGNANGRASMALRDYSLALDGSLVLIETEYPFGQVSQVQLDVRLLDETWAEVVAIAKENAKYMSGVVSRNNEKLDKAIVKRLIGSRVMSATCDILRKHSYGCNRNTIAMNPVAFKAEYLGREWTRIRTLPDAGLSDVMWLGIDVVRK